MKYNAFQIIWDLENKKGLDLINCLLQGIRHQPNQTFYMLLEVERNQLMNKTDDKKWHTMAENGMQHIQNNSIEYCDPTI